jgi:hypothetical protein
LITILLFEMLHYLGVFPSFTFLHYANELGKLPSFKVFSVILSSKGTKHSVSFVSRGRFKCLKLIHASGFVDDCKQTDRTKFN